MRRVKYYYDVESLSYKKIKSRLISLRGTFLFLLAAALFGLFFVYLSYKILESPNEKYLKREVDKMKLEYGLLDKKMGEVEDVLGEIQERDNNIYRLYFEANPIPEDQRKAGFGGVNRYKSLEGFDNSKMITDAAKKMDVITKQLYIQSKSLDEIVKLAENKEQLLTSIPAIQPVRVDYLKRMASGYGWRKD
ncbi:MAG: M23 family peptidase, partial [Flavobacteriaceae bacterium]|nr:M23 family peptidase [Flavobacteriaceae bacterium]